MILRLLTTLSLFAGPSGASDRPPPALALADFDTGGVAPPVAEVRERCPRDTRGNARFELVPQAAGEDSARVLRFDYTLADSDPTPVGIHIPLPALDASHYDHLELRLRGKSTTGTLAPLRVGFRRPEPGGQGLVQTGSFVVRDIGAEWTTVRIPLNSMVGIQRWMDLNDFFATVEPDPSAARTGTYFLDDLTLRHTGKPGPTAEAKPPTPRKQSWIESAGTADAARRRTQQRLVGWPQRLLVPRAELPAGDTEFLRRLARDTWRGLDALRDREYGLPLDTVSFDEAATPAPLRIGDYTNVTNVGLYLISVVAAQELDLLEETEALERAAHVLSTLAKLERHRGIFFNYYDTTTLERSTHFVSFLDAAWLTAGLMVVRSTYPALAQSASALIASTDYRSFYDEARGLMSHGFFVHLGVPSEYHYGLLYTEARLGSLIAIGKGDVPESHWFRMLRIFPAACSWQTQAPERVHRRTVHGHEVLEGRYAWKDIHYVPSWGGSMFEALMPSLVVDEQSHAPRSLGPNGVAHAVVQRRWAAETADVPVWGWSPSRRPAGGYGEHGVPILGTRGYPADIVTPHAAALALAVTPREAIANLRRMVELYDVYGDYGLYDSVDPKSGHVARDYLALDQAMTFIALANHLKPHCIQKRFASDPIAQRALPLLREERFVD